MGNRDTAELNIKEEDLINQLAIIIRTAKFHSENNSAVATSVERFVALANEMLEHEAPVSLQLRGDYFYCNEHRIRYSPEYIINIDYLITEFRKLGVGTLLIKDRLSPEEVKVMISAISSAPTEENPFESIKEQTEKLSAIELKRLERVADDDAFDARKMARKTYFNAVSYAKGVFNAVMNSERVSLKKTKRVISSLVNQILKQEQVLLGMTAIKDYDEYTYYHSTNVSIIAVALGHRLGLNRTMLMELGIAALFHDIGKIHIPPEVLNKPTSLTHDEWKIIKQHPVWGVRALLNIRELDDLSIKSALAAFEHHMNDNFTGYPRIKHPSELSLFSKIVSIADRYDAMTSARVYARAALSPEKALRTMQEWAGKEVDALLFKFFMNLVGIYPIGLLVLLDTKELGLVFENNKDDLNRPRVMVIADSNRQWVKGFVVDLNEKEEHGAYRRSIIKAMDPKQYNINPAEYLL